MRLTTHLIAERSSGEFTTACGRKGIPNSAKHSFVATDDVLEGRAPASAGGGIIAADDSVFLIPNRAIKWCATCAKAYS